jgi:hypothetical protein
MPTTMAAKEQSAALRQRMAEIREDLPGDVDRARVRVRQLTDWKYHAVKHRVPMMVAAAAIGYWLVPSKHRRVEVRQVEIRQPLIESRSRASDSSALPRKRTLLGGMVGGATTLIARQLASMAVDRLSSWAQVSSPPKDRFYPPVAEAKRSTPR